MKITFNLTLQPKSSFKSQLWSKLAARYQSVYSPQPHWNWSSLKISAVAAVVFLVLLSPFLLTKDNFSTQKQQVAMVELTQLETDFETIDQEFESMETDFETHLLALENL